jgi:hypothetical protein
MKVEGGELNQGECDTGTSGKERSGNGEASRTNDRGWGFGDWNFPCHSEFIVEEVFRGGTGSSP